MTCTLKAAIDSGTTALYGKKFAVVEAAALPEGMPLTAFASGTCAMRSDVLRVHDDNKLCFKNA